MRILLFILISTTGFSQSFMSSNKGGAKAGTQTVYYISASGNDSNDGLSPATSITTAKIASLSLNPIDSLNFNRGDSYVIGDIANIPAAIGINSYGSGTKPKIYGSKDLSAVTWANEGGGIYSTVLAYTPLWVYLNGSAMPIAATPSVTVTSVSGSVITATSVAPLSGYAGSFVGAKLRGHANTWILSDEYTVTAYNAGAKTVTVSSTIATGMNSSGKLFFMYGQQQFLASGNWFFDTSTNKLYVFTTTSPSGTDIRAGFYNTFISTKVQLNMKNIELLHYQTQVVTLGPWSDVENNLIHDCRGNAVFGNFSDHSRIINNTVHHCDLNGIFSFRGDYTYYLNNTVYDIASGSVMSKIGYPTNSDNLEAGLSGYPNTVTGQEFMAYSLTSMREIGSQIVHNNIYNIGYTGIFLSSASGSTLVDKNYVHDHTGTTLYDGGLIYTAGQIVYVNDGATISNNVLENGGTNISLIGLYVDNYSQNIKVTNNSVYNGGTFTGIRLNSGTRNHTVTGNKVVSTNATCSGFRFDETFAFPYTMGGCTFTGNQSALTTSSGCMVIAPGSVTPFSGSGSSDNNVYILPYNNTDVIIRSTHYNCSTWPAVLGTDASSTCRTNYITFSNATNALQEVKMERNPSDTPESFNVPAGYSDVTGTPFTNPVTIPAWSSLIYLKDTAFP